MGETDLTLFRNYPYPVWVYEPTLRRYCEKSGEPIHMEIASHDFTFEGRAARMVVAIDVTRRTRVETGAQAGLLQRLECDEMQGYPVSWPLPPAEVVEFLAGWRVPGG